ncbi:MAG: hypothetical protein ABSE41_06310 [Bacteroidota bacterium]|jgi:hypothetical protein
MVSKISRYRKLTDIVAADAYGRRLVSKDLRLLPEVKGTFLHTVEEADRLDILSYKYYKEPRKWWRICDANAEFLSPQALLGKEPIVSDRFPLTFDDNGTSPPWAVLLKSLSERIGVEDVIIEDDTLLVPREETYEGQKVTVQAEQHKRVVLITYNRMNVTARELADAMAAAGFSVSQPANIGRTGKRIVIPPDIVG